MTAEELARWIVVRLREAGSQAYFVGGCVRDRLLGLPVKDYDVATDAPPAETLRLFPDAEEVGASFGVLLVKRDGAAVEVAAFRRDHDYLDGRRPASVSFTSSAREDVERRDFTINALLEDPIQGDVIDYVGGRADLDAGVIRAVGDPDARFAEDKLRLLRAVRFAARLGFRVERRTSEAMRRRAAEISIVAAERVRAEITRILTEGGARRGFELLDSSGLLREILPEVAAFKGVEQPPEFHPEGDVWTHVLLMLERLPAGCSTTLAMGALLHDVGKPDAFERAADRIRFHGHVERGVELAERICRRLRFSNAETERIVALVAHHMRFMHVREMREGKLKRFLRMPGFDAHLELHRLDCLAASGNLDNHEFVRAKLAEYAAGGLRPEPLITGDDLIREGHEPGPVFKKMLDVVEEAQLENRVRTRDEALRLLRREFGAPSPKS